MTPETPQPVEDEDRLRAALAAHRLTLRPEDVAATLATARFLAAAALRVRGAGR